MINVIVTGAAGLIGTNFCEYLLKNKDLLSINKIFGIDNLSGGFIENLDNCNKHDNFKFFKCDLTNTNDQNIIENIFKEHTINYIFHFSAYAAEGLSPFIRQYNYISNIIPTTFLINMAIKYNINRFIFTSSMATYGNNQTPFTEDMLPTPIDPYGIAKYACEMDLKIAYEQHKLEYVIIRPHNVIGKYQNLWDPYRNVLGIWMYKALNNLPFTIYGDGKQTRAFTCVDNILPCLWNAATFENAKNQIINLGGIDHINLNDISKILAKITNTNNIVYLEPRHEVKHAWSSYQKSIDILDYKEDLSLENGLVEMWEWAKKVHVNFPDRKLKYWGQYELEKNIYSYWKL